MCNGVHDGWLGFTLVARNLPHVPMSTWTKLFTLVALPCIVAVIGATNPGNGSDLCEAELGRLTLELAQGAEAYAALQNNMSNLLNENRKLRARLAELDSRLAHLELPLQVRALGGPGQVTPIDSCRYESLVSIVHRRVGLS
jgi:hypothetical protein